MRRLLLATAAASALVLAPFWAAAQGVYGPQPDGSASPSMSAPPAMPPATDPYATTPSTTPDTSSPTTGTENDAQTQGSYAGSQPNTATGTSTADTYATPNTTASTTTTDTYAANTVATAPSPEMVSMVQDMGLSGVPMSANDVCAQRTVSLDRSAGMTRAQKVRFAIDYASVCKTQQVVIRAPRGQQAGLRRIVEDHGVSPDMISTETASSSDASVQLTFAGLATSSAQYAAMFNPQYASNAGYAPTASDTNSYSAPSSTYPATPDTSTPAAPPATDYNNQTTTDTSPSDTTTAPSDADTTPPATPSPNTY